MVKRPVLVISALLTLLSAARPNVAATDVDLRSAISLFGCA